MEFEIGKLIESIGASISEAQQGLENHALQRFFHYFEPVSGGPSHKKDCSQIDLKNILKDEPDTQVMEPVTAKILMPCENDISKKTVTEIPLVTLANHLQVQLDKVTVKVKTKLITDSAGNVRVDINAPVPNGTIASDTPEYEILDSGMIEMVFQVGKMSEGESRVVQNIERVL